MFIKKLIANIIYLGLFVVAGCDHHPTLSSQEISNFVSSYPVSSSDIIYAVTTNKLEVLVNLWKDHSFIDQMKGKELEQFYVQLSSKLVSEKLKQIIASKGEHFSSALVSFVYVNAQDEYGKPDFTSLVKKAEVYLKVEPTKKLLVTKVQLQ